MKKTFLMLLLATAFIMSGCTKETTNAPSSETPVGVFYLNLTAKGLAADIISVKVLVNGEQKALLDKNTTEYKLSKIDLSKTTSIVIDPVFADVAAPTEPFDFGCKLDGCAGILNNPSAAAQGASPSYDHLETISMSVIDGQGIQPDKFTDKVAKLKENFVKAEYVFENGKLTKK